MKCCRCPLYHYWSNESDRGEACAIFGDGWDSPFQYDDKEGTIIGCYLDRHFIEKADAERDEYYASMAESAVRYFEDEPQIIACPINERAEYWFYEDEPQTEPLQTCSVNGRQYSECSSCEHFRCTADEPQTDKEIVLDPAFAELSDEQFVEAMKLIEPQTESSPKVPQEFPKSSQEPQKRCGNCKFLTYRWGKVWCDIKCENPHDVVCDKWERSE